MLREIQLLLKDNKLYNGQIDGIIGIATLNSINSMSKDISKNLQKLLKEKGIYKGKIDGIFGPASYEALNSLLPPPKISIEQLQMIFAGANSKYLNYINSMAKDWSINTKAQMCLFLANILVESNGFNDKDLRENFNYRPETLLKIFPNYFKSIQDAYKTVSLGPQMIANKVYGGRLGNYKQNDGWKYRGGGLIQITGRYNYSLLGKAIKEDLINYPERICEPAIATKSALYYWYREKCSQDADRMEFSKCRKKINGSNRELERVKDLFYKSWNFLS
ncbi:TPA: hypothetical protein MW252_003816 [Acinetobacter nosocomialis]|nr:hypothetical protein [Acinetobacter nosocomialis]